MSRFIWVHDFYRDGYNDMLSEVQDLQAQGLWTKERRKSAAKHEISTYHATKLKFRSLDMGYWAGRVAAIKSAATADYSKVKTVFTALGNAQTAECSSCGDPAAWRCTKGLFILFRCDPCK